VSPDADIAFPAATATTGGGVIPSAGTPLPRDILDRARDRVRIAAWVFVATWGFVIFMNEVVARLASANAVTERIWGPRQTILTLIGVAAALEEAAAFEALQRTIAILRDVRARLEIALSSSLNLFITNGRQLVATRYCFDFGCYRTDDPSRVHEANVSFLSLWYTLGRDYALHGDEWKMVGGAENADSIIVASEPLTKDIASWVELPEYGALFAQIRGGRPNVTLRLLD